MTIDIPNPPKTLMEVYRMLPEGTRAEIIDGILFMSPALLVNHQGLIMKLSSQLFFHCEEENKFGTQLPHAQARFQILNARKK